MKRLLCCTLLSLALAGNVISAEQKFTLTVEAGKYDRVAVPVCVPITLSDDLAKAKAALLHDSLGLPIAAQLTERGLINGLKPIAGAATVRDLHFILPGLKAGQTATFKGFVSTEPVPLGSVKMYSWHDTPGESVELRLDKAPVLRYMYKALDEKTKEAREQTFKVYHHLYDPSGKVLVTKGPGGLYTHHRGLFYGFKCYYDGKVADTWHCPPGTYLAHEKILSSEAGPVLGRHRVQIGWHGPDKKRFAVEERELTVYYLPNGQLVEFASVLRSEVGALKVGGDPQHAGFHFRADNEVSAKTSKETYYLRPDGQGKPGETRNYPQDKGHVNLPWNAMSFVLGPKRYTAVYMDRPENPKEERYSERPYGRFGCYFEKELSEKQPLAVAYRLWLQEGETTGAQAAGMAANFASPPSASLK